MARLLSTSRRFAAAAGRDSGGSNSSQDDSSSKLRYIHLLGVGLLAVAAGGSISVAYQAQVSVLQQTSRQAQEQHSPTSHATTPLNNNPLAIPQGEAQALPSIRVEEAETAVKRGRYGGKGDKQHLGGFTKFDGQGVSPAVWKHMITKLGVKSILDVGCGKGVSTTYFAEQGVDVLCLEGSHDAVEQSLLPHPETQVVEHDFSRGPYWPAKTYDAVWSVEFLEHVGHNYQHNYVQAFRKAAFLFVTHSKWGGWHHVEIHEQDWWQTRFQMFGFQYSETLTKQIRDIARDEKSFAQKYPNNVTESIGPDGKPYTAQHIWTTMMVFINPMVASLPEHAHLLAEPGCFQEFTKGQIMNRDCKEPKESVLPDSFKPLQWSPQGHQNWLEKVKASIDAAAASEEK